MPCIVLNSNEIHDIFIYYKSNQKVSLTQQTSAIFHDINKR